MPVLPVADLRELCETIFARNGFSSQESEACTEEVLDAQMRGRRSHGLAMMSRILDWKRGATGEPRTSSCSPLAARIDGNGAVGPLVARHAMDLAIAKARVTSVGVVGARNSSAFLTAGYSARRAAEQDMIALNCSVAATKVAVWGGATPGIGTNPLSISIPSAGGPVVLDLAVSQLSVAAVRRAARAHEDLPEGAAISTDGSMTTDPEQALAGALLPFGGYKGSGLGIMIELLAGALVGAKTGPLGSEPEHARGIFCMAIDPNIFGLADEFAASTAAFLAAVRSAPARDGFDKVLLPGDRGEQLYAQALETGVSVDEKTLTQLHELAEQVV